MNINRYLLCRLKTLRGMTVVHVGAHLGEEAKRYRHMAARRVVWFEAEPGIHARLVDNLERLKARGAGPLARLTGAPATEHITRQALLGDEDGRATSFHLTDNDGASNSVFQLAPEAAVSFPALAATGETLTLSMRRLDTELEALGVAPAMVDVLVLDVQGAELLVLKGATETLKAARYLEVEVSTHPVYAGGVLLPELEAWLSGRGFRRRTTPRRSHANAIFVRA